MKVPPRVGDVCTGCGGKLGRTTLQEHWDENESCRTQKHFWVGDRIQFTALDAKTKQLVTHKTRIIEEVSWAWLTFDGERRIWLNKACRSAISKKF